MKPLIQLLSLIRNVNNKLLNGAIRGLEPKLRKDLHRWNILTPAEAVYFLKERVLAIVGKNAVDPVLIISDSGATPKEFAEALKQYSIPSKETTAAGVSKLIAANEKYSCIVSLYFNEKTNFEIASALLGDSRMMNVPFEYIGDAFSDYSHWQKVERYQTRHFISPVLHYNFDVMKLHQDSLSKFELKCDVRDYLELAQAVMHISKAGIEGDIAEFGSFRGHSGYLITQLAKATGLKKNIYLFDMFENFPEEPIGIDAFWSKTHIVNFEEVSAKFREYDNVKLVKGDFTKTLPSQKLSKLSLVHVDCDSYRATQYVMEELFEKVLAPGGIMLFEDYGHPGLLGSRVAIDNFFANRRDAFIYFSQASGYLLAYKL